MFGEHWADQCWVQYLTVDEDNSSTIRRQAPDIPYLGEVPGGNDEMMNPLPTPLPSQPQIPPQPPFQPDENMPQPSQPGDNQSMASTTLLPPP